MSWSQVPYNRDLEKIAVWPESPGASAQRISAVWTFSAEETSVPLDLSTEVALLINGTQVDLQTAVIQVDAGSGFCEAGPPCNGACGSANLNGGAVSLLCYKDGPCTPEFCDCDCGYWITSEFEGWDLSPGDEIMVILYPSPGALPEPDTSDDRLVTTYHGRPIGWDRGIQDVQLVDLGGGLFDVEVSGAAGWESQPGYGNLDMVVELRRNGVTLSAQNVPAELDGIFDQPCFESGCGSNCGTFNGIPRTCDPYLWWDCACIGGWISVFPGIDFSPGDEIMVILRPAPGALPEVPRPNDNDSYIVFCCDTSSLPDGRTAMNGPPDGKSVSLQPNQPNPFRGATAIRFQLAQGGPAQVAIYDAAGRLIRRVLDRSLTAGEWSVGWDGRTEAGAAAPSGIYFCRLSTPDGNETRMLTLHR